LGDGELVGVAVAFLRRSRSRSLVDLLAKVLVTGLDEGGELECGAARGRADDGTGEDVVDSDCLKDVSSRGLDRGTEMAEG
jgi:hypothetical protein